MTYANSGYQSMGSPQPVMQPMNYTGSPQSFVRGPAPAQTMMPMPMQVRALRRESCSVRL